MRIAWEHYNFFSIRIPDTMKRSIQKAFEKEACLVNNRAKRTKYLPIPTISEISASENTDWNDWVSASSTRNYALKDPLCDWLNYNKFQVNNLGFRPESGSPGTLRNRKKSFTNFIMNQGIKFEAHALKLITERFGDWNVIKIEGESNPRSPEKVKATLNAMMQGKYIIHGGVLHNTVTKTYGIPDLIVRSDKLKLLVDENPMDENMCRLPAPRLRHGIDHSLPDYHYVIVDIKYCTLKLRADGKHLLNSGSTVAYKTQLCIYNEALGLLQGYTPNCAFIFGRKWCYKVGKKTHSGNSMFGRLGCIDYTDVDCMIPEIAEKAVEWIRDVRSPESSKWSVVDVPLEREELYPNMSCYRDYPWRKTKEHISSKIKEHTALWMVGPKNRKIAHEKGIYNWDDAKCNPGVLGIKGNYTSNTLQRIMDINRSSKDNILPKIIKENSCGWQDKKSHEFYVDFETVNDVMEKFEGDCVKSSSLIFMIGVGWDDRKTGWKYKCFISEDLTLESEFRICAEYCQFINSFNSKMREKKLCIHWAPAERVFWDKACERHEKLRKMYICSDWKWFDLLSVFKKEPIVVKGALSFGLKEISRAMKSHGFVETGWDDCGSCCDGQDAMVRAWECYNKSKKTNVSVISLPSMTEITKYNQSDVKVLKEIIEYLRENCVQR